jgi:hypothetical protein
MKKITACTARYVLLIIFKWSPSEEVVEEYPDTTSADYSQKNRYPDKLFVGEDHAALRSSA